MSKFLPAGYEALKTEKAYLKMKDLKETGSRLRIVMQPIAGWLDWKDSKPFRFRPDEKPAKPFIAEKPIKPFWDLYVWDYDREKLFVLEITQMSILKSLTKIATDEDWGDFLKYDIKISREGSGIETRYVLTPLPPKPMSDKIIQALKDCPVRLEALYEGGDPWTDLQPQGVNKSTGEIKVALNEVNSTLDSYDRLKAIVESEGMSTDHLQEFLIETSEKQSKTVEQVMDAALMPDLLTRFKGIYSKFLTKNYPESASA